MVTRSVIRCSSCDRDGVNGGQGMCRRCYNARYAAGMQEIPGDYDESAVIRAMCGERLPLTRADRLEAVRRLRRRGYLIREIAATLGIAMRQVDRDLAGLGLRQRRAAS